VGVCIYGFCNVWVCVCVDFVTCGCVYVWVILYVGVCMCGFCNLCLLRHLCGGFGNVYCVFVLFHLCIFIFICY